MRYFTLLICLLAYGLSAQPGYRGRKLAFKYQPSFNMNFDGVNQKGMEQSYLPNAIYHGGNVEYVVGRRTTIAGVFSVCKNHINMEGSVDRAYYDSEYLAYSKLMDRKLEFLVKHFRKNRGNLAPLGTYTQFGFSKHWFEISSVKFDEVLYSNSNVYGFSLAWGKQRVYRNCIIFDLNFKIEVDVPYKNPIFYGQNSREIIRKTTVAVFAQNFLSINLGIGLLAPPLGKK